VATFSPNRPGGVSEAHYQFGRLLRRFKVSPSEAREDLRLWMDIQPVTNIDEIFWESKIISNTITVSANGLAAIATVPDQLKWELIHFTIEKRTGTYTIAAIDIRDESLSGDVIIDATSFTSGTRMVTLAVPLPLEQKDSLRVSISGLSGAGEIELKALIRETAAW